MGWSKTLICTLCIGVGKCNFAINWLTSLHEGDDKQVNQSATIFIEIKFVDWFTCFSHSWRLVTWIQICVSYESSHKEESRTFLDDFSQAYRKPRAFNYHRPNLIYKMSFNVNISRSAFVTAVDLLCIFVLIQGSPASKICGFWNCAIFFIKRFIYNQQRQTLYCSDSGLINLSCIFSIWCFL